MFYESELRFLCDTFQKCHVQTAVLPADNLKSALMNTDLGALFGKAAPERVFTTSAFDNICACTMYKLTDHFQLCYIYFLLPDPTNSTLLLIGPYLPSPPSPGAVLEIGEKNGASPKSQRYLDEYYAGLPILEQNSHLFFMLNTFCERIWNSPSFSIIDVNNEHQSPASPISEPTHSNNFDDVLVSMKAMENRYSFENELMRAVTLGQIHKESMLQASFSADFFEKRTADPLRNAKNYCIIMNTLLRKAAEAGGVHPMYLNNVSSDFALKIEQLYSFSQAPGLMRDMFRTYCRLVRKHSTNKYSRVVQKTVLLVDSDLSANLSLGTLAAVQGISPGYLSTVFKKETGKTVSQYIREKRINHAAHLLSTTHLQIQTVALHCGIMDVQYFSKIFKMQTGKTPKEYRESIKQTQK
ncbi:MAG: helix-turn-helix transcriptional regulator [Clostridia bacterium]|nr:helix-turn-helix transcriptional regulator [Clostridia bacterium]